MKSRNSRTTWLDSESRKSLGQAFQSLRRAAGLKQTQVAAQLGRLSPQFISKFERGDCVLPLPKLIAYSRLLRISQDRLLTMLMNEQKRSLERLFRPARGKNFVE